MRRALQQLTTLQIYGAVLDEVALPLDPTPPLPPSSGTEYRCEINLYPTEALNPRYGITTLRITIPGAIADLASVFRSQPINITLPCWQLLETEIIPFLRLPNGLPVQGGPALSRIHRAALVHLTEERRPKPGRPPVDGAISNTIQLLDQARSRLAMLARTAQPADHSLARVQKYQQHLAHLQFLHEIEQHLFQAALQSKSLPLTAHIDSDEHKQSISAPPTNKLYLPLRPSTSAPQWQDLTAKDFFQPALWLPLTQLKNFLNISAQRSFWRALATLREHGLRTLPAKQNLRLHLCYRPDLPHLRKLWQAHLDNKTKSRHCKPTRQSLNHCDDALSNDTAAMQETIKRIEQQQEFLCHQQQLLSNKINNLESALTSLHNQLAAHTELLLSLQSHLTTAQPTLRINAKNSSSD